MRAWIGLLPLLIGCPSKDEHVPAPGVMPDASAAPMVSMPAPVSSAPAKPLPCRAIAVSGKVTNVDAGTSLSMGGQLPETVLSLDEGAKMTVKDPSSGREVTFDGPATVRACVGGDPEHWLIKGTFSATPGAGEKPGAEEWIVTPFGIVRFASALLKITIEKDKATVRVSSGSASVYGKRGDAGPDWSDVSKDAPADLLSPGPAKNLVDTCATTAKTARDIGGQLFAPDANIGELGAKHVEARRKARASCALARAAAFGDSALSVRAEAADAEWRIVAR